MERKWILYIIDMWSRYTISVIINRKRPSDVGNALMQRLIGVFGIMGSTMTDHGGEFSSDEMREIMSILNVKVITTVAESPLQGYVSGYTRSYAGQIWQEISCRCGMGTVAMLVFGRNPKLPGIMTDALPALEGITSSQIFAQHLNMLHKSRSAYIQTDKERFT